MTTRTLLLFAALATVPLTNALALAQSSDITGAMRLDQTLVHAMPNGCRYMASIRGMVTPVGAGNVEPKVLVEAEVSCPHASTMRITDNVTTPGPLTRAELAKILERRATVTTDTPARKCAYVPEIAVGPTGQITLARVSLLCEPPGRKA